MKRVELLGFGGVNSGYEVNRKLGLNRFIWEIIILNKFINKTI
jgi:hypothetical protein